MSLRSVKNEASAVLFIIVVLFLLLYI